jgi:hypothetical protein
LYPVAFGQTEATPQPKCDAGARALKKILPFSPGLVAQAGAAPPRSASAAVAAMRRRFTGLLRW